MIGSPPGYATPVPLLLPLQGAMPVARQSRFHGICWKGSRALDCAGMVRGGRIGRVPRMHTFPTLIYKEAPMLINCVAYQNGTKLADITVLEISDYIFAPRLFCLGRAAGRRAG